MNKDKSIIYYVILGIFCSYFILGNNFFSFTNTSWLNSIDMAQDIVSWKYFKNDIWRFPIGMNPNYGIDIGNDVLEYLAYSISTNIRELEGALISLLAQASLNKKEISISLAREMIDRFVNICIQFI